MEADRVVRVAQDRAADTQVNVMLKQLNLKLDDVDGMRQLLDETVERVEKEEQDTKSRMEGLEEQQKGLEKRSEKLEVVQGMRDAAEGELL